MIEVKDLTKYYGATPALKEISFEVEPGEILGFLGPNGAGKTTAMRILTCFMPATSGKASVGGFDVFKDSLKVREQIGYLPETVPLYVDLTVNEYLNFVGRAKGLSGKKTSDSISKAIGDCGLGGKEKKLIRSLSKGYRQRVGLAQALVGNPKILILDEPTVGLDPKQIIEIRDLIKGLGEERTIILSTHILPEVSMTCRRVIIINEGRIVAEDAPENLMTGLQQSNRVLITAVGDKGGLTKSLEGTSGVTRVKFLQEVNGRENQFVVESPKESDLRSEIAKNVIEGGFDIKELKSEEMTLEDIFIKLVTTEEQEVES